jgi:hypothetical protein
MGTSNFARGNTSKVFAVLMNTEETFKECSECGQRHYDFEYSLDTLNECENGCEGATFSEEETEYRSAESYEYDDFKEYLRETAQEEVKELKNIWYKEESGSDNARNYCATDLFSFNTSKMFGDIEVEVSIIGQIVSAYYEGASLDFAVEFNDEEYTNDEPDFEWLFEYQSDMNKGMQVLQNRNAIKWAEKTKTELIELIEEVFTKVSQPLNVLGTASNGETFYEKV